MSTASHPGPGWRRRLAAYLRQDPVAGRRSAALVERLRHRAVPNHWSTLFGVVSLACLVVLIVTGLLLMLVYHPSGALVRYSGRYPLLRGVEMSRALDSTLHLSFDVRGGLLIRQTHHWAALLLPASLLVQLLTTFFTGAFRRPRQWSWLLLVGIFLATLAAGWSGYALPDDELSGTGLRIVHGVTLGIPVVGTWLAGLIFGGEFPGRVVSRLYAVHLALPVVLVAMVALRLRLAYRRRPAQFPGAGRSEDDVVGVPVWPVAAARAVGLFFTTSGVAVLMGGTMTISPVWRYGPASPATAFAGSQPDWYTGFLDGALRLVPSGWEFEWLGRTWTLAVLVPLGLIGAFFTLVAAYPFLEAWVTGDRREHQLLDRPRTTPHRTGIGIAGVAFYGVLWGAASADLVATRFGVSVESVLVVLRCALVLGPGLGYLVAGRACRTLQERDRERLLQGAESGVIRRLPSGGYTESHVPLDGGRRARLTAAGAEPAAVDPPGQLAAATPALDAGRPG